MTKQNEVQREYPLTTLEQAQEKIFVQAHELEALRAQNAKLLEALNFADVALTPGHRTYPMRYIGGELMDAPCAVRLALAAAKAVRS